MGVTIHYAGQFTQPSRMSELLDFVKTFADSHQWGFQILPQKSNDSRRGFILLPHPDCEPIAIDFGARSRFSSWVKTQFAGPQVHIEIIRFLRQLQPIMGRLGVRDEGEFWTTGNEEILRRHMATINELIAEETAKNPTARSRVRTPDGLIIDLIQ
jgi:hypothetical protein